MNHVAASEEDDTLRFVDEPELADRFPARAWRVLVVDDEADVHEATELALRDLVVEGRQLVFSHAYSAHEAGEILAGDADLAVVLLDVVMESEDAGLRLVRRIREDLGYRAMRIILRTGQPGYAPEIDTIRAYDINDYKTKSELTRVRLFTSLTVAIRSYRQLLQLETGRRGLESIVAASTALGRVRDLRPFAELVLGELCDLMGEAPDGLVCLAPSGPAEAPRVIAAVGRYRDRVQSLLSDLPDVPLRATLEHCLSQREHHFGMPTCVFLDVDETRGIAVYCEVSREPDAVHRHLLEVFCANVTVGFENLVLHQRLVDSAYYDPLLRLPNRTRLIQVLEETKGDGADRVLALIDLDDFAEINTVLDHHFGDQVLQAVASRLARAFAPPVVLARVASDAFALLGPAEWIDPNRIEAVFAVPFELQDEVIRVAATASLIHLEAYSAPEGEILKDASIALKHAKLLNRGRVTWSSSDLSRAARERIRMLTSLRAAFSAERLFLVFQPLIELASGQVVGAEALLRWKTEDGRFVPPDRFIPLAEQSGLMVPIGEWVLRSACRQLTRLNALGHAGFRMAVNVSQTQFREPDFIAMVGGVLDEYRVAAASVELELTESVAIGHVEATAAKIAALRRMGLSISLDDFGTGYSSLSVLKQLDVDRLKIDRCFVREIGQPGSGGGIADLVVTLGRQMGLRTVAEGVETEEQRRYLIGLGCQEGQGYLFGRPLPSEAFEQWLATQAPR